jgi:hypothetical protein
MLNAEAFRAVSPDGLCESRAPKVPANMGTTSRHLGHQRYGAAEDFQLAALLLFLSLPIAPGFDQIMVLFGSLASR